MKDRLGIVTVTGAAIRLVLAALTLPGAAGSGAPDTIASAGDLIEALSGGRLSVEVDTERRFLRRA